MIKIQYVDAIPKQIKKGSVREIILKLDKTEKGIEMCKELELESLLDREVKDLSGIHINIIFIKVVNFNVLPY